MIGFFFYCLQNLFRKMPDLNHRFRSQPIAAAFQAAFQLRFIPRPMVLAEQLLRTFVYTKNIAAKHPVLIGKILMQQKGKVLHAIAQRRYVNLFYPALPEKLLQKLPAAAKHLWVCAAGAENP